MTVSLVIRNESSIKRLFRKDALERLANQICDGEHVSEDVEISVLFCDDEYITELNRQYRKKNRPTDVLSFEQEDSGPGVTRLLGDIVISLETARRNCEGDRRFMRLEVDMLFCHGLLHLLGYDHATKEERQEMQQRQAAYLGLSEADSWQFGPKRTPSSDQILCGGNPSLG